MGHTTTPSCPFSATLTVSRFSERPGSKAEILPRTSPSISPGSRSYASATRSAGVPPWSCGAPDSGLHKVKPYVAPYVYRSRSTSHRASWTTEAPTTAPSVLSVRGAFTVCRASAPGPTTPMATARHRVRQTIAPARTFPLRKESAFRYAPLSNRASGYVRGSTDLPPVDDGAAALPQDPQEEKGIAYEVPAPQPAGLGEEPGQPLEAAVGEETRAPAEPPGDVVEDGTAGENSAGVDSLSVIHQPALLERHPEAD